MPAGPLAYARVALAGSAYSAVLSLVGITALTYACTQAYEWWRNRPQNHAQEDHGYYELPPNASEEAWLAEADARATAEELFESQTAEMPQNEAAADVPRRGPCVCCRVLRSRYAFVQCGHFCICEPCLIRLGRMEEEKRGRPFRGPCRLRCPMCKQESFLTKIFL